MTSATATSTIERAGRLLMAEDGVAELRALGVSRNGFRAPHTEAGYFNDPAALAQAAVNIEGAKGIYITLNPVTPALLARSHNRIKALGKGDPTTSDNDIAGRRWLPIDCDPKRPAGISASDNEKHAAYERVQAIYQHLRDAGWPDPVVADSGNGSHLLYRINLPMDDNGVVKRCLEALAQRFDDDAVAIDTTLYNPARIIKLYGTIAAKGDDTADRPHRPSQLLSIPDPIEPVHPDALDVLADEVVKPDDNGHKPSAGKTNGQRFDVERFIGEHNLDVDGPKDWNGQAGRGRRWIFNTSPLCEHHGDGPHILEHASGAISAGCHHNSCAWDWRELREKYEPVSESKRTQPSRDDALTGEAGEGDDEAPTPQPIAFAELRRQYPKLNQPVIDGLLRIGETANTIAASKVGKSWLMYELALSIRTGRPWLDTFQCTAGRVLLIDNELHPPTIAHRIPQVAEARGLTPDQYADGLDVLPLRGCGVSLPDLSRYVRRIEAGYYKAVIADAWYRFIPSGMNENANADVMSLYNMLDSYAAQTEAAWIVVHHASKGAQGEKAVTDVGAGAGAQSRAADTHLVLREHEEPGAVVMEAAVRSFPPIDPVALRWHFPVWTPAYSLDPENVKGRKTVGEERQSERDKAGMNAIRQALAGQALTPRGIRDHTGIGKPRAERLLGQLFAAGEVTYQNIEIRGNETREYRLNTPE